VIVFSFAGDLWSVPAAGGVADRLTAHPSDEARSAFSPDGNSLAFESERDGPANLYIMPVIKSGSVLTGGTPRRITTYDKPQALSGFSPDGKFVLFSASLEPSIYRMSRMYRAPLDGPETGGAPIEKISDAFGAAPHPASDGTILFNRERFDATRPKYVGPAASDVYKARSQVRRIHASDV
jgi:tricorn protease